MPLPMQNLALYAFEQYGDMLLQYACCCTGNRAEAEDIVQDVLLSLHTSPPVLHQNDAEAHLRAWLLCAVRSRARNFHKSWWKRKRIAEEDAQNAMPSVPSPEANADVEQMLNALPPKYASVLYLYYVQQYSTAEIAKIQQKNESTIRSQIQRGKKRLHDLLSSEEEST